MSNRFNKCNASDFGLIPVSDSSAIDPSDGSVWETCLLYDFGWGKEKGYYRTPLPNYETLLMLVLSCGDKEDQYGAAAIILDSYIEELLKTCETISTHANMEKEIQILDRLFNLHTGINLSPTLGKSWEEINADAIRWSNVAHAIAKKSRNTKKTRFF